MVCQHGIKTTGRMEERALSMRAMKASLIANTLIVIIKFFAWQKTGAISYLSGLCEVFFDWNVAVMNLIVMMMAHRPASAYYRYGYGKAESLGALVQVGIVVYGSGWLVWESLERFANPQPIKEHFLGIMLILLSTVITVSLVFIQNKTLKKTDSPLVSSDAVHARGHLMLNLGIMATLIFSYFDICPYVDPLFGVAVALYMVIASWKVMKSALGSLLDMEAPPHVRAQLEKIINSHKDVGGFHKLRTRYAGADLFIQVHVEMKGSMLLRESHDIAHEIEENILKEFPNAQVVLHQDPIEEEEAHANEY
ncbi:MAG: cation diffusion facilitator family transporter [Alphaproteobacteria bacterium]|nr:cation diffusion facilitator family transporter [Alphaproteobacteria bacterium]